MKIMEKVEIKKEKKKPIQKLITFTENKSEMDRIKNDMKDGWAIVSLVQNGSYFVGVMEKMDNSDEGIIYIPPRKKIKISC